MTTKAEIEVEIHALSDSLRDRDGIKREATDAESAQMKVLRQKADVLRNPPPPPPPPLTANQIRFNELRAKRTWDLAEINELIRLGGFGMM